MDNYRTNYIPSRSCRVQPRDFRSQAPRRSQETHHHCSCSDKIEDTRIYIHADQLPLAMAYIPFQKFSDTFPLRKGFQVGTIFPELCKPFCGRRGVCKR